MFWDAIAMQLTALPSPISAEPRSAFAGPISAARFHAGLSLCQAKLCFAFAVQDDALLRYATIFHSNRPLPLLRHCPMPRNAP